MNIKSKKKIFLFLVFFLSFSWLSYGEIHFTDVSQKYNVRGYSYFGGHGISWADVNSDGLLDFYVKNVAGKGIYDVPNNLFINYGSYFLEEANLRGVSDAYDYGTHGAVFADLDNDSDFDLFSTTTNGDRVPARNHIYQNDGSGFFIDITSAIQPPQTKNVEPRGVAAADFDGDGDLDLYFSNAVENADPSKLFPPKRVKNFYFNNGDGTFRQKFRGIFWTGFTQGVMAVDIDGDGDIDIAEAKWMPPSTIYLNNGKGRFTDAGAKLGLPQDTGDQNNCLTFGDVDNDGDMDLAVRGSSIFLYENTGSSFILYQTIGVDPGEGGFMVCFGDLDHDTDLDLYISGGNVYENDGTGIFSLILPENSGLQPSLDTEDPRGTALGDFDNDGDLDIYISDADYYNVMMRNDTDDFNWILVEVMDGAGAAGGIGTKLDLYKAGHLNQSQYLVGHREIRGEYGYLGQDMPTVHFGAPASDTYDLKVTFFDGETTTVENITAGQKIQAIYPLPSIGVDKTLLSFEGAEGESNPDPQTFKVRNAGAKTLNYRISPNKKCLSVSPKKGRSTGESDEIVVSVDISNLKEGTYQGTIRIRSSKATNSPVKIKVDLTITSASPDLYAPLNFSGIRRENKALFYRESLIFLSWEANPQNEDIQMYRIYSGEEDHALLAELDANTYQYLFRHMEKNRQYRFALKAVDHENRESDPVNATVN